jgi:hypothetical protein
VYSYCVSGLSVASEVDLPGLITGDPDRSPEVTIRHAVVPDALDGAIAIGPTWQRTDRQFLMRIPNIARFLLQDGSSIAFQAEGDATIQDVAVFLSGSVFGVLLHQRNHIVLHASAVLVGGKAVLFCGASGAGKSTLAAALGKHGYPLVADDQCAIGIGDDGVPSIYPDGRQLRLWEKSIVELELEDRRGDAMRDRLQKFYVEPDGAMIEAVPVGAIYALDEVRPTKEAGIVCPASVDAIQLLTVNAYRPLLVRNMGQQASYFTACSALANAAGVFTLTRPMSFGAFPATIAQLEAHWREIGLVDAAP